MLGFFGGGAGAYFAGMALATALTGGVAAVAIIPAAAVWAGIMFSGNRLGSKFDQHRFNNRTKKLPLWEERQATNMFEMANSIKTTVEGLTNSFLSNKKI